MSGAKGGGKNGDQNNKNKWRGAAQRSEICPESRALFPVLFRTERKTDYFFNGMVELDLAGDCSAADVLGVGLSVRQPLVGERHPRPFAPSSARPQLPPSAFACSPTR